MADAGGFESSLRGWILKETEIKEDVVITRLDTEARKAGAQPPPAGPSLKCPKGQKG